MRLGLGAIAVLALLGCSNSTPPSSAADVRDWSSVRIFLHRGLCFGACPSYRLEIHGDGTVVYCGIGFVGEKGERTRKIPVEAVKALFQQFSDATFFNLKYRYTGALSDAPTYTVALSVDGVHKTVVDYVGGMDEMPGSVTQLEDAIDQTAAAAEWIGTVSDIDKYLDPGPRPECYRRQLWDSFP